MNNVATGWNNRNQPPQVSALNRYNPNRADSVEGIWQPHYHWQAYAQAGQTQLTFFQNPVGQGGLTYADTNMQLAGSFPAPTAFFCTGIMVAFLPLNVVSIANAAPRIAANIADVVAVANSGFLEFTIGSKVYLRDAPIGKFAPNFTINAQGAVTATQTDPEQSDWNYARAAGRYYSITPFLIPQTQNFNVTLNWPAAVPVTVAGRIGVILDGFYYRQSQ
jgi:hypothetical protein